jgi:hypothetical protein
MIRKKTQTKHTIIDLTGPEGNAYVLLGYASRYAKELNLDVEAITKEMKSSDYENLIKVFDKYFGEYFILER